MDAVQALRRGGADVNKERLVSFICAPNITPVIIALCIQGSGWTALFFAAKAGKSDVFRELLCRGAVTETSLVSLEALIAVQNLLHQRNYNTIISFVNTSSERPLSISFRKSNVPSQYCCIIMFSSAYQLKNFRVPFLSTCRSHHALNKTINAG